MFTGIIQGQAIIKNKTSNFSEITFETDLNLSDCKTGSSINCDGICLTATSIKFENNKYLFTVNISEETLKRSTTKFWNNNYQINLEKSISSGSLAIVPSSFIISQITAEDPHLANLDTSTEASVCPALTKTPPSFEIIGKT